MNSNLYIDKWSEINDKKDHLIKTFEGKVRMERVTEQNYLGFVVSEDGSNMKNIEVKEKRAIGIKKRYSFPHSRFR